jgi:hypothetical protein
LAKEAANSCFAILRVHLFPLADPKMNVSWEQPDVEFKILKSPTLSADDIALRIAGDGSSITTVLACEILIFQF